MITTPLEGCHTTQGLSHLRLLQSSTLSHLVPCSAVGKFLLGSLILQRCRTMGHHWHLVPDVPDVPNMPNVPRGAQTCSDMPRRDQLGLQIEVKCFRLSSLFFFLWGGLPEALYVSNKSFRNTTRRPSQTCPDVPRRAQTYPDVPRRVFPSKRSKVPPFIFLLFWGKLVDCSAVGKFVLEACSLQRCR
jgi:hypothetical protein